MFDETDTSPPRLTKQLKPPPAPPSAEPRPLCLLDLPAGVVANIAQFIDIEEFEVDDEGYSIRRGDTILRYLCLVFGRQTARVIRREYLSNNLSYLYYLSGQVRCSGETNKEEWTQSIFYLNGALTQWMEENEWWKDACRDADVFAKGGDVCAKYPPIYKTKDIKIANDEERNQWNNELGLSESSHLNLHFEGGPLGDDYTIVLAADDINLMNHNREMTWEQVREAIVKEGNTALRLMHTDFAALFLNPALAMDLRIFELFRFQVEELKLDVNCQGYLGLFFAGVRNDEVFEGGQPLLLHALMNPDKRFFECLLSVADFEANPVIERDIKDGRDIGHRTDTFLHRLPSIMRCDLPNKINLDWVAHMIKLKEVDVGVQNVDESSPLEELCNASLTKSDCDVAKMLLSAGAEVTWSALERYVLARSNTGTAETSSEVLKEIFLELLKQ